MLLCTALALAVALPVTAAEGPTTAQADDSAGVYVRYLPVMANLIGSCHTKWLSDLVVANDGDADLVVAADWFPFDQGWYPQGPAVTKTIKVPARWQVRVADAVATLFSAVSTRGGVRLSSSLPFSAHVRTYNDQRANPTVRGTMGQLVESQGSDDGLSRGVIHGLVNNANFRTNIGWFSPYGGACSLCLDIYAGDNTQLGQICYTLMWYENAITRFTDSSWLSYGETYVQDNFYITFSADCPIYMFATVIDNVTGDAIHIPARPLN